MPGRPERILLFRSGRHLEVGLRAIRRAFPGSEITVVTTPAAAELLETVGIDRGHQIVFDRGAFFHPWRFVTSAAAPRAWMGRFDRVCVLWNNPDGDGQANVDRTALTVLPSGFTAITADGTLVLKRGSRIIAREVRRALISVAVIAATGLFLFLPARILRPFRA